MNSEEVNREWACVCDKIKDYPTINYSQMSAFFSRLYPQVMSEDFLMLTADNDFIKTWIERHYVDYMKQALKEIHGVDYTIAIEVDINQEANRDAQTAIPQNTAPTQEKPQPLSHDESPAQQEKVQEPEVRAEEEQKQTIPDNRENETNYMVGSTSTLTFENFVIGESNRMAYSMSVAVAEEPGRSILNPLFIYGKSGLGKTHLMRAVQNYLSETRPELRTVYVDSADFLSEYVDVVVAHDRDKQSYKNFKNHYQEADVLLIDDIQYLQGKEQTLDIVFQIFNKMVDEGKQVILSADRAPKNITMDERYQSRFNSGGTFDIQPPEVETKLGIIKSFVREYAQTNEQPSFDVPEEIEVYIAENSSSNIRELKSAVTKVIYKMNSFDSEPITVNDVKVLLEDHFSGGTMKKLNISDIQKQVEQYYGVPHTELIGQKRSRKIVYARQVAIYLSRQMLDLPYNTIAKDFGGRDHTTIMYSVDNIEEKLKENRELREELENIKRKIKEM